MKKYLFLYLISLPSLLAAAQQIITDQRPSLIISGKTDSRFYGDTIYISLSNGDLKNEMFGNLDHANFGISRFRLTLNKEGAFYFSLPGYLIKNTRLFLSLFSKGKEYGIMGNFIIRNKDNIRFSATYRDNQFEVQFAGAIASRYNCQWKISRSINQTYDSLNKISEGKANEYSVKDLAELSGKYSAKPLAILNQNKKYLDTLTYQILKDEIIGSSQLCWLDQISKTIDKYDSNQRTELFELVNKVRKKILRLPKKTAILSITYLVSVNELTNFNILIEDMKNGIIMDTTNHLARQFNNIKNSNSGILRDYLLFQFLRCNDETDLLPQYNSPETRLWKDAFSIFKIAEFKEFAKKQVYFFHKGAPFHNFILPDTNNVLVDSRKFRGKVMLIDVWFTRCHACLEYAKRLHNEIYPTFDGDTDLVFISISGDKDQKVWLSSVHAGQYTRPKNVNLYTSGAGFTHPFTKYYDFESGPNSVIIDKKGKIFIINPTKYDMTQLALLLRQALQEP